MTGKGVAFNTPPEHLIPSIRESIDRAVATLPAGASGALVGVATPRGANAAIVARTASGWQVAAWVGKTWESSKKVDDFGARVMRSW